MFRSYLQCGYRAEPYAKLGVVPTKDSGVYLFAESVGIHIM